MIVKFTKAWSGIYGVFPKGRVVELPPVMLAAAPKNVYEEVKPEDVEVKPEDVKGTESNGKSKTKPKSKAEPKSKADTGLGAVGDSR